jgi:hypothetical protein
MLFANGRFNFRAILPDNNMSQHGLVFRRLAYLLLRTIVE